jgi:hypothetical protein
LSYLLSEIAILTTDNAKNIKTIRQIKDQVEPK